MSEIKKIKQWKNYKNSSYDNLKNKTWLEVKAEIEKLELTISAKQQIDKISNSFIESLELQTQVFANEVIRSFYDRLLESFPQQIQKSLLLQAILRTFDKDLSDVEKMRLDILNSLNISTVSAENIYLFEKDFEKIDYILGFSFRRNKIKAEMQKKWRQLNKKNIQHYANLFNQGKIINVFIENQTLIIQMQVNNDTLDLFKTFILNLCEAHLDLKIIEGAVWKNYKITKYSDFLNNKWNEIERGDLIAKN